MTAPTALSDTEIQQVVASLAKCQRGQLPLPIFIAIAQLTVSPILEMVPVRMTSDSIVQVLLVQREATDPIWPNALHVPGTVIRSSDQEGSFDDALNRILKGELAGTTTTDQPQFVELIFHEVKRGRELSQIYYVELAGEPKTGTFYNANELPSSVPESQLTFIGNAVTAYKTKKESH